MNASMAKSKVRLGSQLVSIIKHNFSNIKEAADLQATIEDIDWPLVFKTSSLSRLSPLVYYTLKQNNLLNHISEQYLAKLKGYYFSTVRQNTVLLDELKNILQTLKKTKIKVLVIKGVALAEFAYPHLGLRPMADIDLLLSKKTDISYLEKVLNSLNFKTTDEERTDNFADAVIYETTFYKKRDARISVDVHHTLPYLGYQKNNRGIVSTELVWRNAKPAEVCGQKVFIMSPEDAIPNLIGHELVQHKRDNALFYCDLGFLIKSNSIDWQKVLENLKYSTASIYAEKVFTRAKTQFEIPIPQDVIENSRSIAFSVGILRQMLTEESKLIHVNFFDNIVQTKSVRMKASLLFRYVFPSTGYMRQAYNVKSNLYLTILYLYRPLKISIKTTYLLARHIFGNTVGKKKTIRR